MDSWVRNVKILLVVFLVAIGLFAVYRGWRNARIIAISEKTLREHLNRSLESRKLEPIRVISLPTASRVFGVPEQVEFEHSLFRVDDAGGRYPAGRLIGAFDRISGELQVDIVYIDGKRERGLTHKLTPIP